MRKGLSFSPPDRDSACDRSPAPRQPSIKPGQKLWRLKRQPGEDAVGAQARARTMPWWSEVIEQAPYWTATMWMWLAGGRMEGHPRWARRDYLGGGGWWDVDEADGVHAAKGAK